jgi:acyl-CoA synthetase (AMP-forming)/AMP-acid ligase II
MGEEYEFLLAAANSSEPPNLAEPEDILIIYYTSGTTGQPKAAAISQRAILARTTINNIDRPCAPDEGFVAWAPYFHMGSGDMIFTTLLRGAELTVMTGFDAPTLVSIIEREKIGWLQVLPGIVDRLLSELKSRATKPKSVRYMGVMVDLVPPQVLAELTTLVDAPYANTFGCTETGAPPLSKGFVPVGVVPTSLSKSQASLCQMRLVDPEDRDVPDGEPGEVIVRGPSLFSGYWGAPEATAEDFRGSWFHMGDVFIRNSQGTYDFVDRRKYLIKSGGENIYPAEIERLLLASPRIAEAVVVRRRDDRWGEVPVAFVVPRDPRLTQADVIDVCRGKIANYKLPKHVRFVVDSDLPRSTTGKVKRHELEQILKDEVAPQ